MTRILAMVATLFLASCAHPIVTACPPIPEYSREFQTQLADELGALGDVPSVRADIESLADSLTKASPNDPYIASVVASLRSLAQRLASITDRGALATAIIDYHALRQQLRACRS